MTKSSYCVFTILRMLLLHLLNIHILLACILANLYFKINIWGIIFNKYNSNVYTFRCVKGYLIILLLTLLVITIIYDYAYVGL